MTSAIKMLSICNDMYEFSIVLLKTTLKCPVGVCVFELESHVSQADLKHSGVPRSDLEMLTLLHPPPKSPLYLVCFSTGDKVQGLVHAG